jgi:hypothetical protein
MRYGEFAVMDNKASRIEKSLEPGGPPRLRPVPLAAAEESEKLCSHVEFLWPPDSLTQLLMTVDGVTENELGCLLRKIALARSYGE